MKKKRHWVWNLVILITLIICVLAFLAHAKNWTKSKNDRLRILSGVYKTELNYSELDSVKMVPRIPHMERVHGFSAWEMEKGVFKDSVNPENRVSVYVDNLMNPKIRIVHHDSLLLYLNFSDSLETAAMFDFLEHKIDSVRSTQEK